MREADVSHLELAVNVNQEVTRIKVTTNEVGGLNALETAKSLTNKRQKMGVGEWLLGSDLGREHPVIGRR